MHKVEQNNLGGELQYIAPLKNVKANKCDNPQSSEYNCEKSTIHEIGRSCDPSKKDDVCNLSSLNARKPGGLNNIFFSGEAPQSNELLKKESARGK
mgnify:FL=1